MLANKHPDEFKALLEKVSSDIVNRLDTSPIGKPSAVRLQKTMEGGLEKMRRALPSRALAELYYGADASSSTQDSTSLFVGKGVSSTVKPTGGTTPNPFGTTPFGTFESKSTGGFGQAAASFGATQQQSNPFGGSAGASNASPFGNKQQPPPNPFGGSQMVGSMTFGSSATKNSSTFTAPTSSPFGSNTAPSQNTTNNPFGSIGTQQQHSSPFGTTNGNPFGGSGQNSPFSGGTSSQTFGGQPPFGSSAGSSRGKGSSRKQPCRFFASGKCKYGNNCKFSHESGA